MSFPSRQDCVTLYQRYYCEENVYNILRLAAHRGVPHEALFGIFISNPARVVPFQFQAAKQPEDSNVCFWDYHVVAAVINVQQHPHGVYIYDVDSILPFPTNLHQYVSDSMLRTLPNNLTYADVCALNLRHEFRVVPYDELCASFSSDRRHMHAPRDTWVNANTPKFKAPPPRSPCITASQAIHPHTLPIFLKMSSVHSNDVLAPGRDLADMPEPGHLFKTVPELFSFFSTRQSQLAAMIGCMFD